MCPTARRSPTSRSTGAPGLIAATHLYGALDCGLAVNRRWSKPRSSAQMIQSVSRVLKEEVRFDNRGVTSLDWESYPVLRFAEHPAVTPVVVQRIDEPATGAGEEGDGCDRRRDCQRLLRRYRRTAAAIPDDARACAGGAGGADLRLASYRGNERCPALCRASTCYGPMDALCSVSAPTKQNPCARGKRGCVPRSDGATGTPEGPIRRTRPAQSRA